MYETMTVKELRVLCKERNIPQQENGKKFTKNELIEKLQEHDLSNEEVKTNVLETAEDDETWDTDIYTGEEENSIEQKEEEKTKEEEEVSKEKVNDFAHTLDEIKTKYGKDKPDWVYKLLRIDSKVIFVETVKAKNGNEYEKLRSGIVVATKKEKEENIIYVATFYGDVRKIKEKELLYILEPGCESYRFPKDIRVFLKNQRTKKGASDIVQRFKN